MAEFTEETPMPGKTSFRFLVLAALFTLVIPLAVNTPGAAADGEADQFSIPEKTELKYPNLGSRLDQLVARAEEGEATAEDAAGGRPGTPGRIGGGGPFTCPATWTTW